MSELCRCRAGCTWTGPSRAHCSSCHETFGGVTGFDQHRRHGRCLKPGRLGFVQTEVGVWVRPNEFRAANPAQDSGAARLWAS